MTGTLKFELCPEIAVGLKHLDDLIPHWHMTVGFRIANNVAPVLGS